MLLCLTSGAVAFGQTETKAEAKKSCPISIVGTWRSEAATATPVYLRFAPDGNLHVLTRSADLPDADFEITAGARYKLDKPTEPKRLDIIAARGNELFGKGTTSLVIKDYGDESFTTTQVGTGQQTRWVRVQTTRYFLTFAARSGPLQDGGPAFAMWTKLDGRKTEVQTLGIHIIKDSVGRTVPVVGAIPASLTDEFVNESRKESDVMMRLELTEAEFERTYKVFKTWDKRVQEHTLLYDDPYLNAMEFLRRAAEAINQCGEKVRLHKLTWSQWDEVVSKHNLPQHPLEYIRIMRVNNDKLHVTDAMFPTNWQPTQF
jgi:hypothetical protein